MAGKGKGGTSKESMPMKPGKHMMPGMPMKKMPKGMSKKGH